MPCLGDEVALNGGGNNAPSESAEEVRVIPPMSMPVHAEITGSSAPKAAGKLAIGLVQINNSFSGQNYLPYTALRCNDRQAKPKEAHPCLASHRSVMGFMFGLVATLISLSATSHGGR